MTKIIFALTTALLANPAWALEPIPGSLTYGGGPHTKLLKSPIGSSVTSTFYSGGQEYEERYILLPDRSLRLISRGRIADR